MTEEEKIVFDNLLDQGRHLAKRLMPIFQKWLGKVHEAQVSELMVDIDEDIYCLRVALTDKNCLTELEVRQYYGMPGVEPNAIEIALGWNDWTEWLTYKQNYYPDMSEDIIIAKAKELLRSSREMLKLWD